MNARGEKSVHTSDRAALAGASLGGKIRFQRPGRAGWLAAGLDAPQGRARTAQVFSGIMYAAGRRITNPPDPEGTPANLPHMAARRKLGTGEIVAARDEGNGW